MGTYGARARRWLFHLEPLAVGELSL